MMPVPAFTNDPLPLITPEYVVLVLFPPAVNVPDPNETLPPNAPPVAREPIVSLKLFKLKTTPATFANTTALPDPTPLLAPNANTPELTVVVPVYVFALLNVNVPVPDIVKPPVPEPITPENVVFPAPFTVNVAVLFVILPPKVNNAVAFVEVIVGVPAAVSVMGLLMISVLDAATLSDNIAVPVNVNVLLFASVAPPKLKFNVDAVATAIVPPLLLPKPFALVTFNVPALTEVLPV